jgi:ppGpp synthetase/RelA/SpoT-type nucleotidyltranferase
MDPDRAALRARAAQIAAVAHAGDVDRAGRPYLEHIHAVADSLEGDELKTIGLLHDLVEDHPEEYSFDRLRDEGFGDRVVTALQHLTRYEGDNYWDYLRRVADDELAVEVKLADLASNSDRSRIPHPTLADETRWAKYARGIDYLTRVQEFRRLNPGLDLGLPRHRYLLHRLLYDVVRSDYVELAGTLETVLRRGAQPVCAGAIVQARAKNLDSFTEKCARKSLLYEGGVFANMTDLSAARVVLQTMSQVTRFCRFIEDAFIIDWVNSEDAGVRLGASEFGYRSHHYVVSLKPEAASILGVPVDTERLRGVKAEIQVRTLAQHAVADTLHDRMYKSTVRPLPRHEREQARIASILENSDRILDAFVTEYDEFALHQSAFLTSAEIESELAVLDAVGSAGVGDLYTAVPFALKRAGLLRALGRTEQVATMLEPFFSELTAPEPLQLDAESDARIRFEYGLARLSADPADPEAAEILEAVFDAYAWVADEGREAWLGDRRLLLSMLVAAGTAGRRADWLHRALRVDVDDPYAVAALLGLEPVDDSIVQRAIAPGVEHAQADVNEPDVHFVLGRLRLSLGDEQAAVRHYTDALLFYRGRDTSGNERLRRILDDEIDYLGRQGDGIPEGLNRLLRLAANRIGQPAPTAPGLTWVAEEIPLLTECASGHEIRPLPELSLDSIASAFGEGPAALFLGTGNDLMARAALGVGAEVFVTDREAARRLASDERVRATGGLRTIPLERETLFGLFAPRVSDLTDDVVEEVAAANHERGAIRRIQEMREASYRDERDQAIPTRSDIGERTAVWHLLLETYRTSGRDRVRWAPFMLASVGYEFTTERESAVAWDDMPAEVRERLARLEHGRWIAERVRAGWVQHPPRDNHRLMHDLIVGWDELAPETRRLDFEGISDLIDDFATSGYFPRRIPG